MSDRADRLGLGPALADWLLPALVGAMSFLAALAIAGALGAGALATHWQSAATEGLTIQVTSPADPASSGGLTRLAAVMAILAGMPAVRAHQQLTSTEVDTLIAPWLGADAAQLALPLPAVITASWDGAGPPDALRMALDRAAPGTLVETGASWTTRVAALTTSIEACAGGVLATVVLVAASVVTIATRAGLAAGREAIAIIHGLGALDRDIAARFARRVLIQAACGGAGGALLSLPVLLWLASLAAPFAGGNSAGLPASLWAALPVLPVVSAAIGWATAQFTVRFWLRGQI